jgi:hypothetical protein
MAAGRLLNTQRHDRIPLGLKAEGFHHIITHNRLTQKKCFILGFRD